MMSPSALLDNGKEMSGENGRSPLCGPSPSTRTWVWRVRAWVDGAVAQQALESCKLAPHRLKPNWAPDDKALDNLAQDSWAQLS